MVELVGCLLGDCAAVREYIAPAAIGNLELCFGLYAVGDNELVNDLTICRGFAGGYELEGIACAPAVERAAEPVVGSGSVGFAVNSESEVGEVNLDVLCAVGQVDVRGLVVFLIVVHYKGVCAGTGEAVAFHNIVASGVDLGPGTFCCSELERGLNVCGE